MLAFASPSVHAQPAPAAVVTLRASARCASEIVPRLYLADYSSATDARTLARLRVTHVLSCMEDAPPAPRGLARMHVPVSDVPSTDLGAWFARTNVWIADAMADPENVVLVHCLMGMSRSATVVAAYLVHTRHLYASDAIAFVRARRRIVRPNFGFVRQLEAFSDALDRSVPPIVVAVTVPAPSIISDADTLAELKRRTSLASRIRRFVAGGGLKRLDTKNKAADSGARP